MNIYEALIQGDASIKEPHITSIFYYFLKKDYEKREKSSLLLKLIELFITEIDTNQIVNFNIENDIKIEQILSSDNQRKDCDITIYLETINSKYIINIENKISLSSFDKAQINEQSRLLMNNYPDYQLINVLLLPYESQNINIDDSNVKLFYWYNNDDKQSISKIITHHINRNLESENDKKTISQLIVFGEFFTSFEEFKEQDFNSDDKIERGPRNNYDKSMFDYLKEIADNWSGIFGGNMNSVTVQELINIFEERVIRDLRRRDQTESELMIAKFRRGAKDAQPKIMTINEKNRCHFQINNPNVKRLFYYPDYPDGLYDCRWKDLKIKPLTIMNRNEENSYVVFWKDKVVDEIRTSLYSS